MRLLFRFLLRPQRHWLALLLLPALLAGCRSERVAFEFQPGPKATLADSARPHLATQLLPAPEPSARPPALSAPAGTAHSATHTPRRHFQPAHAARPSAKLKVAVLRQVLKMRPAESQAAHQAQPAAQGLGSWFVLLLAVLLLVMAGLAALITAVSGLGFWAALGIMGLVLLAVLLVLGARGMLKS